jgi:molybdopterin-containing oxidoreductase family membrane subunit
MAQITPVTDEKTLEISPVIAQDATLASVTDKVGGIILRRGTTLGWILGFAFFFLMLQLLGIGVTYLLFKGVGIWGLNIPIGWGFAIVNFVWWIGIGHAGTLISAILLLLNQSWRNSINRFAEAMTIFAVCCAGMFPIIHMGRSWIAYWLFPYPNTMAIWPQFRSPLAWDVFAVSTYFTISLVFWYVGLIPDFASLRDQAKHKWQQILFGSLCLGWRGSAFHWARYEKASLLLAGLSTPLVLSVHSVISFDFSISILPGWHTTIFPPYFVAGAVYDGFAMVLTLMIPLRKFYGLEGLITARHINNMAKVMLATGLIVAYGYGMEAFFSLVYANDHLEKFMMQNRMFGPYGFTYWLLVATNIAIPQLLWVYKIRNNLVYLWLISMVINVGMWLERFVIVITSLTRDFVPSSWGTYWPTIWDWIIYLGTIGLFMTLIFLFVRVLPMITMFELRVITPKRTVKEPVA